MNTLFTKGYALLIGVGKCKEQDLSLPTTVKDTGAIYNVLIDPNLCAYPEDNIQILNNEEATKANILEGLQWLIEKAQSDQDATILIYYSGHGWLNKENAQYYLIPHDTKITRIAKSALSADEFTQAIREINSERLLVIIDSCHAAGMATSKDAETEFWEKYEDYQPQPPSKGITSVLSKGKGRVVFTSSQGKEKSWIMKDNSLSVYTFHLLEALQGAGNKTGDNVVKVSNLMNYLGETVPKTANDSYSASQIPRFDFDTDDFAISMLRGGEGLPDKGWDVVNHEARQTIYKIADNITQHGKYITTINEWQGGHIGDVYHGNVTNKNYQQNENQGKIYNADEMTINQDKQINQSHSGRGDNVARDKTVTNNYGIN